MKFTQKIASAFIAVFLLSTSLLVMPTYASQQYHPTTSGQGVSLQGPAEFARCFVNTVKWIPQAKKLSPVGYQNLENTLKNFLNGTKFVQLGPYLGAIRLGVLIGKIIGFDLVWYFGVVQSCWRTL